MNRFLRPLLILISLCVALSCNAQAPVTVIVTDLPEVIEYLEFLREGISPPHFRVIFDSNPDRSTVLGDIEPDIIISSEISNENFASNLFSIPISHLSTQDGSNTDSFILADIYPQSYSAFRNENSVYLFPLAFDLPIVYLSEELNALIPGRLRYSDLLEYSAEFTTQRRENYSEMGFSSMRNILFIDLLIRQETGIRGSIPHSDSLAQAMALISEELRSARQSPIAQIYFNEVFAYSSDYSNIMDNRLFASLSSFYAHSSDRLSLIRGLPFSWLYADEYIEALNPIYIGILQNSRNRRQAIQILRRLLSADSQRQYIIQRYEEGMPADSFLSRLSSNRIINEFLIRELNDRVREIPRNIVFPDGAIFLWKNIQSDVYYPWIANNLLSESPSTRELYEELDSFYKLNQGYQ